MSHDSHIISVSAQSSVGTLLPSMPSTQSFDDLQRSNTTFSGPLLDVGSMTLTCQLALNRFDNAFHNLITVHQHALSVSPSMLTPSDRAYKSSSKFIAFPELDAFHSHITQLEQQHSSTLRDAIARLFDAHSSLYPFARMYSPESQARLSILQSKLIDGVNQDDVSSLSSLAPAVASMIRSAGEDDIIRTAVLAQFQSDSHAVDVDEIYDAISHHRGELQFRKLLTEWMTRCLDAVEATASVLLKTYRDIDVVSSRFDSDQTEDLNEMKFTDFFAAKLVMFQQMASQVLSAAPHFPSSSSDAATIDDAVSGVPLNTQFNSGEGSQIWQTTKQWFSNKFNSLQISFNNMFNIDNGNISNGGYVITNPDGSAVRKSGLVTLATPQAQRLRAAQKNLGWGMSALSADSDSDEYEAESDSAEAEAEAATQQAKDDFNAAVEHDAFTASFAEWFKNKANAWPHHCSLVIDALSSARNQKQADKVRKQFEQWLVMQVRQIETALDKVQKHRQQQQQQVQEQQQTEYSDNDQ